MKKNTISIKLLGLQLIALSIISITPIYAVNDSFYTNTVVSKELPKPVYQNKLGTFSISLKKHNVSVDKFINELNNYFDLNKNHSFKILNETVDKSGNKSYVFQHYYNDIKLEGNTVVVQYKDGNVLNVFGQLKTFNDFIYDNSQVLNLEKIVRSLENNAKIYDYSLIEKVIIKKQTKEGVELRYVSKIKIDSESLHDHQTLYVDNSNGEIIYKIKNLCTIDTPSNSSTLNRGTKSITVDSYNGEYRLKDNARNIHTLDATGLNGRTNSTTGEFVGNKDFTNSTASFTSNAVQPAVEVHWGMSVTHDYYKNIHNRDSYDNNGSIVRNYYNPPSYIMERANAGAIDRGGNIVGMLYGNGGNYMYPVVALDVAGHEFSHLVIGRNGTGGLVYQGESGALNESFADMFATAIEFYTNDQPNWTIGEGIFKMQVNYNHMRNMQNPNNGYLPGSEQPDTYLGDYWADTNDSEDSGGVHTNSGVGNYWFYLLSEGGNGVNDLNNFYLVSGIGIKKAEQIAYNTLMSGLSTTATYLDVYNASIIVAENLYGVGSNEWEQVVNAWYAVGIGDAPASTKNIEFESKLRIYPNPVNSGVINIESELKDDTIVELYDLTGKRILNAISLDFKTVIDVSTIKSGMYILKFKSNAGEHSHKIMIK